MPRKMTLGFVLAVLALALPVEAFAQKQNVILFVPDGLRASSVDQKTAPTMARVRALGVNFVNSHALFPTFTMPNGSVLATGHFLGDTGNFGNTIYTGWPVASADGVLTPFIEDNAVLGELNTNFAENFLNERSLNAVARLSGYATAVVGKHGPVGIFDVTARTGEATIVFDDATGRRVGIPVRPDVVEALKRAGLPLEAPTRGDNGTVGDARKPGTHVANIVQQKHFREIITKVLLPHFKEAGKPFILTYWSRDPDGTQHNQGDSLGKLEPGINGPTSLAAIKNADDDLTAIIHALRELGLEASTNIVIAADHGFTTISKESATSPAAYFVYPDVIAGQLPPGFVAIDLAEALGFPLFEPSPKGALVNYKDGKHPRRANGFIGKDPAKPDVVVAANGGSDLVYLPQPNAKELAPRVVRVLLAQDYVSGLFVDDALGEVHGTLPLSAIGLKGSALTPAPAIVISFRSFGTGCAKPVTCTGAVADTLLQQGQGMHGTFSRADTENFMAAIGPAFKKGYRDRAPVSNADVAVTLAHVLGLELPAKGNLRGRVVSEALPGGKSVRATRTTIVSAPENGLRTVLNLQYVGHTPYYDAGGFVGRTVGLHAPTAKEPSVAPAGQQRSSIER